MARLRSLVPEKKNNQIVNKLCQLDYETGAFCLGAWQDDAAKRERQLTAN